MGAVDHHAGEARLKCRSSLCGLRRGDVLGIGVDDGDLKPLLAKISPKDRYPEGWFDSSQLDPQPLVDLFAITGIDQYDVNRCCHLHPFLPINQSKHRCLVHVVDCMEPITGAQVEYVAVVYPDRCETAA